MGGQPHHDNHETWPTELEATCDKRECWPEQQGQPFILRCFNSLSSGQPRGRRAMWRRSLTTFKPNTMRWSARLKGSNLRWNIFSRTLTSPSHRRSWNFPYPRGSRFHRWTCSTDSKILSSTLRFTKAHITLHAILDKITCISFPLTLKGPAQRLFENLQPKSIGSFSDLCKLFLTHFIVGRKCRRSMAYLLTLNQ